MMRFLIVALILFKSAFGFGQKADFFVAEKTHKFPKTKEGPVLKHDYILENRGTDTLKITQYKVSCSCTTVQHPLVVPPGKSDTISVLFDTKGKYYQQDRKIIFFTNTKTGLEELRFKVFVIPNE